MILVLDFDGTLHRSDLFCEQCATLISERPSDVPAGLLVWAAQGRPGLKSWVHARVGPPQHLPWNSDVLEFIRASVPGIYSKVLIVTAGDEVAVRDALGVHIPEDWKVLGSSGKTNLKGAAKLPAIREHSGGEEFCYVADHAADLPIWKQSARIGFVGNPTKRQTFESALGRPFDHVFLNGVDSARAIWKGLYPHRWLTNLLVFVPLFASLHWPTWSAFVMCSLAFLAFSCMASASYLMNGILGIWNDRCHRTKPHRPLAAGEITIPRALLVAFTLAGISILFSATAPLLIASVSGYFVLSLANSTVLKHVTGADLLVLGLLPSLRIIGGSCAYGFIPSARLIAFSFFVFFALSVAKRFSEWRKSRHESKSG